jgi:phospholipase C
VIVGENRSFDHVFATYKPRRENTSTIFYPRRSSRRTARPARNTRLPPNTQLTLRAVPNSS